MCHYILVVLPFFCCKLTADQLITYACEASLRKDTLFLSPPPMITERTASFNYVS